MSPLFFLCIYTFFLILIVVPSSYCSTDDGQFTNCSHVYNCGNIRNVEYPFWGGDRPEYCGRPDLGLNCVHDNYSDQPYSVLTTGSRIRPTSTYEQTFRVLMINQFNAAHTMRIVRKDLWNNICPDQTSGDTNSAFNSALNYSTGNYAQTVRKLNIFYGCNSTNVLTGNLTCQVNGTNGSGVVVAEEQTSSIEGCYNKILVPVMQVTYEELMNRTMTLRDALNQGFDVDYNAYNIASCKACKGVGGVCGSDSNLQFVCFCRDRPHLLACSSHGRKKHSFNWRIGVSATAGGMGILFCFVVICYWRYKHSSDKSVLFWKKKKGDHKLEALIEQYGPLALKRYSYSGVKKMTNSLRDKLGQGGYGSVYKGNLPDGRLVAVKILSESKGNGEEFMNEVASISRTSHVNVVTLLGFCLEGGKRALVYEFMPNGSLEKFIYGQKPWTSGGYLGWEKLYKIAIGIGQGLEYLHRGCNTRILHLDIKPHNILLDEEFCPKIADFGLAKLCSRKESMVSMLEARGTIGYIAPELFSRNFGGVSHKSDVYSYGMMVLEMVGGRKNIDMSESQESKIYFPHWAYKRLELNEDLGLQEIVARDEYEIARKMILVGLWCIQSDSSKRPSMKKVIDMLEGSIEAVQIPPKPFFFSPSQSLKDSSTTSK